MSWAQTAPNLPVVDLIPGQDGPAMAGYVRFAQPFPGPINAQDISEIVPTLEPLQIDNIQFQDNSSAILIATKLRNIGTETGHWILTSGRGQFRAFALYEWNNGALRTLIDQEDRQAAQLNVLTYQALSHEISLMPGEERLYFFHFMPSASTYTPIRVETAPNFFRRARATAALIASVTVGTALLLLINAIFFSLTGKQEFIWLSLAEIAGIVLTAQAHGFLTNFWFVGRVDTLSFIDGVLKGLYIWAMAQFARAFVKTQIFMPRADHVLRLLKAIAVFSALAHTSVYFIPDAYKHQLYIGSWLHLIAVTLFLPYVAVIAVRRFGSAFAPLLVGWCTLAIFVVYTALVTLNLLNGWPVFWHMTGPLCLFECLCATASLGLHARELYRSKKHAEAELRTSLEDQVQANKRALALVEEKAEALSMIDHQTWLLQASAHDSRQVLLALNSVLHLVDKGDLPNLPKDIIQLLRSSAAYLDDIIATTLSGAEVSNGRAHCAILSQFSASDFVKPLEMIYGPLLRKAGLDLRFTVDPNLIIISNRSMLMRAVSNFVSNSYKFTRNGGVHITIGRHGNGHILITVQDTGIGISDDTQARLMDKSDALVQENEELEGSGFGFKASMRMIQDLAGHVEFSSTQLEGTMVTIVLPDLCTTPSPCSTNEFRQSLTMAHIIDVENAKDDIFTSDTMPKILVTSGVSRALRSPHFDKAVAVFLKPLIRQFANHPLVVEHRQKGHQKPSTA